MSFQNPANIVTRWSVVGMEGMWAKMWDPPTENPPPTDEIARLPQTVANGLIRPNPVPEVMFAAGRQGAPTFPHVVQRDLLHGLTVTTWDGLKQLQFMVIGDSDNPAVQSGSYPGPTLRMPRGVIFNADVSGKGPPPHTIHWHGMEPTPLNDGVGHCSMELGHYHYQWQPNFMGFYFLHCHRNTVQHFEFGLYSALIFEAPDTYFASIRTDAQGNALTDPLTGAVLLNNIPVGHCRDGRRRVACNLDDPHTGLPKFDALFPLSGTDPLLPPVLGFNRRPVDSPDDRPLGPTDTDIRFPTDPHAMTVPFDVEALMVFDDRDSVWSDLASNARATFPAQGTRPGFNDDFNRNPGVNGFFAFNDFNADYWFVTGVPVPGHKGETAAIPPNLVIPPELNSGIVGTQISVNAATGDTILLRILDAAYNCLRVTLPVDCVVIAWDGRALGVAPFAHNHSFEVKAGDPIEMAVGRRFDALCRSTVPVDGFIVAQFIDHTSQSTDAGEKEDIVMTARVPFTISGEPLPPVTTFVFFGAVIDQLGTAIPGVSVTCTPTSAGASAARTVVSDETGKFFFGGFDGMANGTYEITASKAGKLITSSKLGTVTSIPLPVTCSNQNVSGITVEISIADFAPGSYTLPDALNSLRDVVGLRDPTPFEKFRYDVAPLLPKPDGIIDIRDSLNLLRMVVGLPPQ